MQNYNDSLDSHSIDLTEHPEGGRFREVFRSARTVSTHDGTSRSALTHIYFSLDPGEVSRFHKVASDEVWNLYRGEGIILYNWKGAGTRIESITLSADNDCFCHVIPANTWQAAEPLSDTILAGCSVAPGFEFADFVLMDHNSEDAKRLIAISPEMARFITPVTSQ